MIKGRSAVFPLDIHNQRHIGHIHSNWCIAGQIHHWAHSSHSERPPTHPPSSILVADQIKLLPSGSTQPLHIIHTPLNLRDQHIWCCGLPKQIAITLPDSSPYKRFCTSPMAKYKYRYRHRYKYKRRNAETIQLASASCCFTRFLSTQ